MRQGLLPVVPDDHAQPRAGRGRRRPKKKKKGRIPALERALPDPVSKVDASFGFGIHVMGIGGTGSVTVVATLANAARLEGKHVIGLDQTGLAQKGGAVISDIKITNAPFDGSNKISDGRTDLYLGFDILNATDPKNLDKCLPERTIAVVSTTQTPTGQMVSDRHVLVPGDQRADRRHRPGHAQGRQRVPRRPGAGRGPVRRRDGDQQLHGRRGLPGRHDSAEGRVDRDGDQAVRRRRRDEPGGVPVGPHGGGRSRVRRGRDRQGHAPQCRERRSCRPQARAIVDSVGAQGETKRLLEVRVPDLIDYQDEAYAKRYADVVKRVVAAEQKARAGQERPRRSGGALPLQADGLQGRVRGRAAAHRPGVPGQARRAVQARLHGQVQPRAADDLQARPGHRRAA